MLLLKSKFLSDYKLLPTSGFTMPLCGAFESEATGDKLKRAHTKPGKFSLNERIEKERLMVQASLNINRNVPRPNLLNHFYPFIIHMHSC